jgi:hypothetical protein
LLILPNLEDEIHLKGVVFVTPEILIIVFNKISLGRRQPPNPRAPPAVDFPRSLPLRGRGVVQELRTVVRKSQVPHLGVTESYIAGTPTPEQVLAAARLPGLCVVVVALQPAWIPWLSSPRRAPHLGTNPAPSHARELGVDLRRRDRHRAPPPARRRVRRGCLRPFDRIPTA